MVRGNGNQVRSLLLDGVSYNQIAKQLGCSKGTIAYHARCLKFPKKVDNRRNKYDWKHIQECYDAGETTRQLSKRFGFSSDTWARAAKEGKVVNKPRVSGSLAKHLVIHENRIGGWWLKKKLIDLGVLENKCAICGCLPIWRDLPLVLRLDHINGDSGDCREENLRFVCPNCDSQLPTFTGRNIGRKKKLRAGVAQLEEARS
jgi:hypothetical protein